MKFVTLKTLKTSLAEPQVGKVRGLWDTILAVKRLTEWGFGRAEQQGGE